MSEIVRLLLLLALAGAALTALVGVAVWRLNEERRIRRALTRVLGLAPEAMLVAHGDGRGAGFSFQSGSIAVAWSAGAWCLVYGLEDLVGAELLVDHAVAARAFRGEPRRPLDRLAPEAESASLRLVFDDPAYPDFEIRIWPAPARRRGPGSAREAIAEANRWLARVEAVLRRPAAAVVRPEPMPAPLWRNHDEIEDEYGDDEEARLI